MAARGARAAGRDAGDWIAFPPLPRSPDTDLDRAGIDYLYRMMKKHGIARKE
jgi:hypothetical protein